MNTAIIGLSGPSSSGKTTLARLLQSIFAHVDPNLQSFIIHEDDFYHSDDKIPYTKTKSGEIIQDWDCAEAIDIAFLTSTLAYVHQNGSLPPRLKSKEDLNDKTESGVGEEILESLKERVRSRLFPPPPPPPPPPPSSSDGKENEVNATGKRRTLAFLEGFLLYSPPAEENPSHILRDVHALIDVHLFLPAPYDLVKERRERRSGYVTIGPAPVMETLPERLPVADREIDLHGEDDRLPQNFWTDPPGYVDDIVWPRYVQDHAWLLLPETGSQPFSIDVDPQELIQKVGQAVNLRLDAGITVGPGKGDIPMVDLLIWAVDEVLQYLEQLD